MNISAVFIVDKECIDKLYAKEEAIRMEYVLGIGNDKTFENYIKDMEDFVYAPSCFYTTVVQDFMDVDDILNKDLECIFKLDEYQMYIVQPNHLSTLRKRKYNKRKMEEAFQVLYKETKDKSDKFHSMLKDNMEAFMNLFLKKYPNHYYGILVFKMN